MLTIGLSSCNQKEKLPGFFSDCAKAGIGAVELSCSAEDLAVLSFEEMKARAEENGVRLWSLHLPFCPFSEIDLSVEKTKRQTLELLKGYIKKGTGIGIGVFVVHPSGEPIEEKERQARMALAGESLSELADYADAFGGVIAVEDLPRTCLGRDTEDMRELLSANDKLRVCFDTNHLLRGSPREFIRAVGEKIVTVHVSDYDMIDERHWLPGEGSVNWPELYGDLLKAGYRGPWLYEVGYEAPAAMPRSRALTCEDFVRNAREIFSGEKLTAVR